MPQFGNIVVPDNLMPGADGPTGGGSRPGYGQLLKDAASQAYAQVRYGLPLEAKTLSGNLTPEDKQFYEQGLAAARGGTQAASVDDVLAGRVGVGRFIGENLIASLPSMAGVVAGSIGGGLAAGPVGAVVGGVAGGTPQFVGSNVDRAVQEQGGLDYDTAVRSAIAAPLQSASDMVVERYMPGFGKLLGPLAARQEGNLVGRIVQSAVKGGAAEAVAEASQQVGERYSAGVQLDSAQAAKEYIDAAVTAFGVGGVLGAGGGFRRHPADVKSAEAVTTDDLMSKVDEIVAPKALPAPEQFGRGSIRDGKQLDLGLQGGEAVGEQPMLPMQDQAPTEVPPSQLPQLPGLFPALSSIAPETQLELGQVVTDNLTPQNLAEIGTQVSPQAEAVLALGNSPATPEPLLAGTSLRDATGPIQPNMEAPAAPEVPVSRPFEGVDMKDLEKARRAKNADPAIVQAVEEEIGLRQKEDPFFGVPMNQDLAKLRKAAPEDLRAGVLKLLEDGDSRKGTLAVAERLGIDINEKGTALTEPTQPSAVTDQPAPAAPVTPEAAVSTKLETPSTEATAGGGGEVVTQPQGGVAAAASPQTSSVEIPGGSQPDENFSKEWDQLKKTAGVDRVNKVLGGTPTSMTEARAKVMDALATDSRTPEGGPSAVEKLARKMGLITDDDEMNITPKGRQAFLNTSSGLEEIVSAARQQGYDGKQASIFERGVRAASGGPAETRFASFDDMAAYQAGKNWAQDFVQNADTASASQTQKTMERLAKRGSVREAVAPRERTPGELQRRGLNQLIDSTDLTGIPDQDIVALRRMVAEGATPQQVGEAIQKLQGGESIRMAPARPAPRPTVEGRGQPVFKEMAGAYEEKAPGKAAQRAETATAARAYNLRQLIEFAKQSGGITEKRAAKLHDMLDQGKVDQTANLLKDFDPDNEAGLRQSKAKTTQMRDAVRKNLEERSAELERAISDRSFGGVVDHVIENAPSRYHREIMRGVKALMQKLERSGVKFEFRVVRPGEIAPRNLLREGTKAIVQSTRVPLEAKVYVKATEFGFDGGVSYEIVAHELIHAVTQMAFDHYSGRVIAANDKLGQAVSRLGDLMTMLGRHFDERRQSGNLNEFEQRFLNGDTNAFANMDELVAWGLTNPEMQRYLATIEYKPRQSVWSRFVQLVKDILGIGDLGVDVKENSALAELLRASEQIMDASQGNVAAMIARYRADGFDTGMLSAAKFDRAAATANRTVQAANDTITSVISKLSDMVSNLNTKDMAVKARRTALGWLTHNQIDRQYGREVLGAIQHSDAHRERTAIRSRFELMAEEALQGFEKLENAKPDHAKWVGQLMALTTEFQIDPTKSWEEHTWLGDDAARIKPLYDQAVKLRNDLKRGDGAGWQAFHDFRTYNEAQNLARMAVGLHGLVATDPELSLGIADAWVNPADEFMRAEGVSGSDATKAYWEKALDTQLKHAMDFITARKGEYANATPGDQRALRQHLSPIEMQISSIMQARQAMARAPYFHLGRFGDYFGSGMIRRNADGSINPQSRQIVADALAAAGFQNAQLSTDNTRPKFMLRFDTADQEAAFRKVVADLEAQGHIEKDSSLAGPRTMEQNYGVQDGLPQFVTAYIQNIETSSMFAPDDNATTEEKAALEAKKQAMIQLAKDTWLESQPDNSISKVLVKRYTVPGYDSNMTRNWAHRQRVGAINIANVASAPKFNAAFTNMKAQYNEALQVSNNEDPGVVRDVMSELKMRDARIPVNETADTFDKLRAVSHSFFLGMSPAYGMVNLTQLGVTALPELAKKHGYTQSFHAMRRAGSQALAVVKAVGAEAAKLGWQHWGDVAITERVLQNAGLDAQTRNFVTHMLATGTIDIGSMARALGQIADNKGAGGKLDTYLKLSSAVGLYTETFSRLITALAARDLHGSFGEEAQNYASKVVSESMFDYQTWNTQRKMGKRGILGPVTPMVTQFMSYQTQMLEKLYSEVSDAFAKPRPGESAEAAAARRKEARTFIGGHLAAVTALAGTMGLPFATVFATVLERLLGDDDEPFDASAAYRDWLSSVLGKDAGEVLARGLPRALGFDLSARAGEQNLLPFSELLADRRSWKEAMANSAQRGMGAAPSMVMSVLDGGNQIADGDVLGGLKAMLPVAYKSPLEAYRMTTDGYIDSKGNRLPLSPGAGAILWQLMGFTPAEKAEYSEARVDQMARRGELTRRAGQLRNQIVKAVTDGDTETARSLIADAAAFDRTNPAFAVIPSLSGAISRDQQGRARAVALQAPIGVSMQDIAGQGLTRYANVDYR